MVMTASEREELEQLRRSAARFMSNPVDVAFFELQNMVDNPRPNRLDSVLPTSSFYVLARALIALKQELVK